MFKRQVLRKKNTGQNDGLICMQFWIMALLLLLYLSHCQVKSDKIEANRINKYLLAIPHSAHNCEKHFTQLSTVKKTFSKEKTYQRGPVEENSVD